MNKENPEENPAPEEKSEIPFNETEFNTIIVGKEGGESPLNDDNFVKTLLNLLDSGNTEDKDSALDLLKKENAVIYLIEAIKAMQNNDKKAVLLAACWETGLSFKGHHDFFIEHALHVNPLISLEAITVLDSNLPDIPKEETQALIDKLAAAIAKNHDNSALLEDLKTALEGHLNGE
ncbi:MAG TPA: hypothetical protein VNZ49_06970 [Bacteroidia bacterium]|jgi:hypothetical protein|nr:hypothetical protein [Bacteroidia bacterium]